MSNLSQDEKEIIAGALSSDDAILSLIISPLLDENIDYTDIDDFIA